MVTNSELYTKYGKDIVFLFKGQEPYVESNGYPMGVLIERNNQVLCNECEGWFDSLQYHLRKAHKMKVDDYKEKYGFNKSAPLCSTEESAKRRSIAVQYIDAHPEVLKRAALGRAKAKRTFQKRKDAGQPSRIMPKKTMQGLNSRNACPEQIRQRYRILQANFGKHVGLNTIRRVDPGVEAWGVRHCGGWNNFKALMGEQIDTSSRPKEVGDLIYDLRTYIQQHKVLPWNSVTKAAENDFPHSMVPYLRVWGSVRRALMAVGATNSGGFLSTKHGNRKEWKLVD